jgi:hypothetical protein
MSGTVGSLEEDDVAFGGGEVFFAGRHFAIL